MNKNKIKTKFGKFKFNFEENKIKAPKNLLFFEILF